MQGNLNSCGAYFRHASRVPGLGESFRGTETILGERGWPDGLPWVWWRKEITRRQRRREAKIVVRR